MPTQIPLVSRKPEDRRDGPQRLLSALALSGVLAAALLVATMPAALVLPALSVLAVFAAGGTALLAWRRAERRRPDRVGYWDVAGALALVGVCAALLGDPEQALPLLEAGRLL